MPRVVMGGPWDGHRIGKARKAGRCDYNYGKSNGGQCQHVIQTGELFVYGEIDPYSAGGFGQHRYCFTCAKVHNTRYGGALG
jgi:hypothetical protein